MEEEEEVLTPKSFFPTPFKTCSIVVLAMFRSPSYGAGIHSVFGSARETVTFGTVTAVREWMPTRRVSI